MKTWLIVACAFAMAVTAIIVRKLITAMRRRRIVKAVSVLDLMGQAIDLQDREMESAACEAFNALVPDTQSQAEVLVRLNYVSVAKRMSGDFNGASKYERYAQLAAKTLATN